LEQLDARIERRLLLRVLRTLGDVALELTSAGEIALSAQRTPAGALLLGMRADGFVAGAPTAAQEGDIAAIVLGDGERKEPRARRLLAMRLAIAARLVESHPGTLRADPSGLLSIEVDGPGAAAAPVSDEAQASADVALALSYMAAMGHDLRTPLNAILG